MTRKLLLVVTFFSIIFFAANANAENSTTGKTQTTTGTVSVTPKVKPQIQLLQEEKKTAVKQIKNEAQLLIQTRREEFNSHVAAIKDMAKKTLVERIDTRITEVNASQTARFSDTLDRLQTFINKVKGSATATASLADITAAQKAVDAARTAVEAQAAKSYIMTIADDSTLKINAGKTVSQFRHDLMAVYDLVLNAKQAVQKLYILKNAIRKDASSSAKQ
jgi:hypothetical protein